MIAKIAKLVPDGFYIAHSNIKFIDVHCKIYFSLVNFYFFLSKTKLFHNVALQLKYKHNVWKGWWSGEIGFHFLKVWPCLALVTKMNTLLVD